jgi:hypothetical protein
MLTMRARILAATCLALSLACGPSTETLVDWPAEETPAPAPRPAEPAPAVPTCRDYCRTVQKACSGANAQYDTQAACRSRCRSEAWPYTSRDEAGTNTLSCRIAHASDAATMPSSSCPNAGAASPACVVGGPLPPAPPLDPSGKEVVGLCDSTDGPKWKGGKRSCKEVLGRRVAKILESRGLEMHVYDVSQGLPEPADLAHARAIVTSFYDDSMTGAATYLAWLRAQLDAGRKVVVLNDLGAWREQGSEAYDLDDRANLVLEALGVRFEGDWTKDGKVLETGRVEKGLFRRVPRPSAARHYFRFVPEAKDLHVVMEVRRKDLADSASPVVFASPRGGMALTRYYEDINGVELLDLRKFLELAIP